MEIQKMLLEPNIYSRPRLPLNRVTKIAVHYIGNAGTSAKANRNYFDNLKSTHATYASSHYIIGLDGEIIQCIPEDEVAYCTNEANSYSISIENCHPKADGKFTEATRKSLIELCADICKRYNLDPIKDIIRHFDVSGKACPLYWVNHPDDFAKFKKEVAEYIQNGGEDMSNISELEKRIQKLESAQNEKRYKTIDDIPLWAEEAIKWFVDNKYLNGDGENGLDLTYENLRILVICYRAFVSK